jgi:hypothetical protein
MERVKGHVQVGFVGRVCYLWLKLHFCEDLWESTNMVIISKVGKAKGGNENEIVVNQKRYFKRAAVGNNKNHFTFTSGQALLYNSFSLLT